MAVRVAIVGLGRWGANLLRVFSTLARAKVTAVCDPRLGPPGPSASGATHPRSFRNLEQLIAAEVCDAVVLATPANTHASLALTALKAGKHVFVEKPMALNLNDAGRLVRRARLSPGELFVGHLLIYHPAVRELRRRVTEGELGRVHTIRCFRTGPLVPRRDESPWWSLAPHDISLVRHLFQEEPLDVSVVPSLVDGGSAHKATLHYPGGKKAVIVVGDGQARKTRRTTLVGSLGKAEFDDSERDWSLRLYPSEPPDDGVLVSPYSAVENPGRSITLPRLEPLHEEAESFVECVVQRRRPVTDVVEGWRVVAALCSGEESLRRSGALVPVPAGEFDGVGSRVSLNARARS